MRSELPPCFLRVCNWMQGEYHDDSTTDRCTNQGTQASSQRGAIFVWRSNPGPRAAKTNHAASASAWLSMRFGSRAGVSISVCASRWTKIRTSRIHHCPVLTVCVQLVNMIESAHSVVRHTCRNAGRWRDARMALRWTGAGMLEAGKRMRRLKARRQPPVLRVALEQHHGGTAESTSVEHCARAA